jgi:hypothetical protein
MKIKTIGLVAAVVLIGGGIANAQVDFGKLLGALNFADEEQATNAIPLSQVPQVQDELPAPPDNLIPDRLPMPPDDDSIVDMDLLGPANINREISPVHIDTKHFGNRDSNQALRDLPTVTIDGSLNSAPSIIESQPIAPLALPGNESVDLDQIANQLEPEPIRTNAYATSYLASTQAGESCGTPCSSCGHKTGATPRCLQEIDLPPAANFQSFYRTPACFRGLWSGYGAQKAVECSQHHKHLHGTCSCAQHSAAHNVHVGGNCVGGRAKCAKGCADQGCNDQGCATCGSH